jgi:hypothetical protein
MGNIKKERRGTSWIRKSNSQTRKKAFAIRYADGLLLKLGKVRKILRPSNRAVTWPAVKREAVGADNDVINAAGV